MWNLVYFSSGADIISIPKYLFSNFKYSLFDAFRDFHAINSNLSPELFQIFPQHFVIVLLRLKHDFLLSRHELTDNKAIDNKKAGLSGKGSCRNISSAAASQTTLYCIPEVIATLAMNRQMHLLVYRIILQDYRHMHLPLDRIILQITVKCIYQWTSRQENMVDYCQMLLLYICVSFGLRNTRVLNVI